MRSVALQDWPKVFWSFSDNGFEQSGTYAEAAARRIGGRASYVVVCHGQTLLAAAALRKRLVPGLGRGIVWCPSGPLVAPHDGAPPSSSTLTSVLHALRNEFVVRQGHILRFRLSGTAFPAKNILEETASLAGFSLAPSLRHYSSSVINLCFDEETLIQNLHGKWRTDLRFALKSDIKLENGSGTAIETRFLKLFEMVQVAKGFRPDVSPEFHFGLSGSDYAHEVLIATHKGRDIAGVVIGHAGACTTYLFGATTPEGRPLRAGYFLTWKALQLARSAGSKWYDLGGIDTEENPDVARFKRRMGGTSIYSVPFEACSTDLAPRFIKALESVRKRWRASRDAKRSSS